MRRILLSIVIGIIWFVVIGFFQYKGENPQWYCVASVAGIAACAGYFSGYGDGKNELY